MHPTLRFSIKNFYTWSTGYIYYVFRTLCVSEKKGNLSVYSVNVMVL